MARRQRRNIVCSFVWKCGTLNDNGTRELSARNIPFMYYYQQLYGLDFCGRWCRVEYDRLPPASGRNPDTYNLVFVRNPHTSPFI